MTLLQSGNIHAQGSGDGVRSMTTSKGVVFALRGRRERFDASQLAIGVKAVATTSENFMSVGLVSDIPHDAIVGRCKHIVQRHGEFDGSET